MNIRSMRAIIGIIVSVLSVTAIAQETSIKHFNIKLCSDMVEYKGEVYFCGEHRSLGKELFRSNGTHEGTFVVSDIDPGLGGSNPSHFFILRDRLYFFAETASLGKELWRTDGTDEGTKLIKDTVLGSGSPELGQYVVSGNNVAYFDVSNQIWRTDGSSEGTAALADVQSDGFMAPLGESLIYTIETDLGKTHLKKIGESSSQGELITDFENNCGSVSVRHYRNQGGDNLLNNFLEFYSWCNDPTDQIPNSATLVTDGTKEGTRVLSVPFLTSLGKKGTQHFFQTDQNGSLFITDGVSSKTVDFCAEPYSCESSSYTRNVGLVSDKLLYAMRYIGAEELWSTDGTLIGTKKLIQGLTFDYASLGNRTVFTMLDDDGVSKRALHATSGTTDSTLLLKDFGELKNIENLGVINGKYYFAVAENLGYSRSRSELWRTDGTVAGTEKFLDLGGARLTFRLFKEGERLYFTDQVDFLWHTDGRADQTFRLTYEDFVQVAQIDSSLITMIMYLLLED